MATNDLTENHKAEKNTLNIPNENFCYFNVLCVFISLVFILADLTTDILVFVEYYRYKTSYWALSTLIFILTPNILVNIFSLRWLLSDGNSSFKMWITHSFLIGLISRYVLYLHKAFTCKNLEFLKTQKLQSQKHDLSLLHFLYLFTGTVPQIILQSYSIIILDIKYYTKVISLIAALGSLLWGCSVYTYTTLVHSAANFKWSLFLLTLIWHFAMLIGRISGIILFTVIFKIWILVLLGLHWLAMTFWILMQKTTFCQNKIEETLYNVVMGFVYCFSYINLKEGHTRYRLLMFCSMMVVQNFGCLLLYVLLSEADKQKKPWSIAATVNILCGTIIGIFAMIMYYRYFHTRAPIFWNNVHNDVEFNNKNILQPNNENKSNNANEIIISFKNFEKNKVNDSVEIKSNGKKKNEEVNVDSKNLFDHWVARTGTPTFVSAPTGDTSIEIYSVENTPEVMKNCNKVELLCKKDISKKKSLFSPLKFHDNHSENQITREQDICTGNKSLSVNNSQSKEFHNIRNNLLKSLKLDHASELSVDTEGSNKKTSSDSIDMDLDLSFSDINSSDINTFNENIVQKLCLSALKSIKVGNQDADIENIQRIALDILKQMYAKKGKNKRDVDVLPSKMCGSETPTESLSVHDYENICAVNIAREAWGLRSWNVYCDIENWLHDNSIVRERQYGMYNSGSSEVSSYISYELRHAVNTAPPPTFPKKTHIYSNVLVHSIKNNLEDTLDDSTCQVNNETYLAKPCLVETLDHSQLEPILEEIDGLYDMELSNTKRLNSKSSLVATIDEIRKNTSEKSPQNMYKRRCLILDPFDLQPCHKTLCDSKSNLKECSDSDMPNTMELFQEKENLYCSVGNRNDQMTEVKDFSEIDLQDQTFGDMNENSQNTYNDFCNEKIDYIWQLVSDKTSNEYPNLSNKKTVSMQSLITSNICEESETNIINMKKVKKNKPRRKFSLLREKFELKTNSKNFDDFSERTVGDFQSSSSQKKFEISGIERLSSPHNSICLNEVEKLKNVREKPLFMRHVLSPRNNM